VKAVARGAALARRYADLAGRPVARLDQLEHAAKAFPIWLEESMARWQLLDRPRKPVDRDRLARSRAAFERGECEDVGKLMAQFDSGNAPIEE
jgi:hypothetical protein